MENETCFLIWTNSRNFLDRNFIEVDNFQEIRLIPRLRKSVLVNCDAEFWKISFYGNYRPYTERRVASENCIIETALHCIQLIRPGFHYTTNATTTTQKQSDYKVEQSSFTLIALFWLKIGRCRGRNWLKAWFPLSQLRPQQRPISSQNKAISVKDDCSTL